MTKGYFVAGTDTGVGKSIITASLIKSLTLNNVAVAGMKPIASGCYKTNDGLRNEDADLIMQQSNVDFDYDLINPFAFESPVSPHFAAKESDQKIDIDPILKNYSEVSRSTDYVLVEGVGGWQVPISDHDYMSDLAIALRLPIILVVGLRLGCINHALLTARMIREQGLELVGCVANQIDPDYQKREETVETLELHLDIPVEFVPYIDPNIMARIENEKLIPEKIIHNLENTKQLLL